MDIQFLVSCCSSTGCLSLCITTIILYYALSRIFRGNPKSLPPGPRGWRTNWEILKATWNDSFIYLASDWAQKYGPITFVYSLGQPLVLVNCPDLVRKLNTADEYKLLLADRIPNASARMAWYNGKDLIFSKFDSIMRKKRRMLFSVIGLYGEGVAKFENVVWNELERVFTEVDRHQGQDFDFPAILSRSLISIIYIMAVGKQPENPDIPNILEEYDVAFNKLWAPDIDFVISNLPWLTRLPGRYKRAVDRLMRARRAAEDEMYYKPKKTYVPGEPRGIADLLFDLQKKPGNEWMQEDPEHLLAFLTSLFFAAHMTTRASLLGIFLILLNYPQVAKYIQQEVDQVIGNDRPRLEFRSQMPKTEAAILESFRLISQAPLSGLRTSSADIHLDDMVIPKNSLIFFNNWHFFHDEKLYPDPWVFKPERFLDSKGQLIPHDHPNRKNLIVFGVGPRSCPGEGFARSRVFLFMTSILQRFDLLPPADHELVPADFKTNHEDVKGFIRQIRPYTCRLVRRKPIC